MEEKGMRVIELRAENYKKLLAVEIHPDPNIQVISGANAAGKSSVLDAIWAALGGSDMAKGTGTTEPIRHGQGKANVFLDLGDIRVTRKWTKSSSTLVVENKDGVAFKSPQAVLDELIGKISLDPLSFANSDEKTQRETLLSIVNIALDLPANAKARQVAYEERTIMNRDLKTLQGQVSAHPLPPEGTPEKEIDVSEILTEQEKAQATIRENDNKRKGLSDYKNALSNAEFELNTKREIVEEAERKLESAKNIYKAQQERVESFRKNLSEMEPEVASLVDPDLSEFKSRIAALDGINKNVRARQARSSLHKQIHDKETAVEKKTKIIEDLDSQRQAAISAATFPVPGLGFNDVGVLYNGIPFSQCSGAEKLRVSVAIAMATSPKIRVIRITDGSLIDSANMKVLEEMAKEQNFQVWIERVEDKPGSGIFIVDGSVLEEK